MLVEATNALFGYGKRPVVRVDQLHVRAGRSLGIFGPNGSGKTTLVRGLSGLLPPITGSVTRAADLRIGYLPQYRRIALQAARPASGVHASNAATTAHPRFSLGSLCQISRGPLHQTTRDRHHQSRRRRSAAPVR